MVELGLTQKRRARTTADRGDVSDIHCGLEQISVKRMPLGLVDFVPHDVNYFFLTMPAAFTQPGVCLLAVLLKSWPDIVFLPAALAEAGLEITFQVGPSGMDCWRGR